ncbi:NUDIX domain-containing protein [Paenibacillus yanchengensis]|uniref:NUDIX domain-containing protein n=1 Tax=Paenibacillus yanchengensis TaxID=2035833 RepID=A0ABW4YN24_9BACL
MLKYTLGLIKQDDQLLLLNREKSSWMGCWNGVGGKLERGESPEQSMYREIVEETSLEQVELTFKGINIWSTPTGDNIGGMYLYVGELQESVPYTTPLKTEEGILDWKQYEWIMHKENRGIATNLRSYLPLVVADERQCRLYHSVFEGENLIESFNVPLDGIWEANEGQLAAIINSYMEDYKRKTQHLQQV